MNASAAGGRDELYRWADQIPGPLWDDLCARPAGEAAAAVAARLEEGVFKVPLLGTTYAVDPRSRTIARAQEPGHRVSYQTAVVLLTALARSLGVPPSERMVSPLELQGGTEFFTGAHALAVEPLVRCFGQEPGALVAAARSLGGTVAAGADCAVRIPGLPLLPLHVLLWTADREFEARAVIGIDSRALFHLDLSGVFALTNLMVARLVGER